jgi:homoserine kinase type II
MWRPGTGRAYCAPVTAERIDSRACGSDALVAEIVECFALPRPVGWRDLGGSWTTNLLLDCPEGPLVARVYQGGTLPPRLSAVQAARRAVAAAGIPTPQPISAVDGRSLATLRCGRLVEVEAYVRWNERMNTVPLLLRGFAVLAQVHDILRTAPLPAAARTVCNANHLFSVEASAASRRGSERIRGWSDPALSEFADQVVRHVDVVTAAEEPLRDQQLCQVVHGDFWDNNVLFADGLLVAVLDFDFMAERPRVDDLALAMWFFLLEPAKGLPGEVERAQLRAFVDAYDDAAAVSLSPEERTALPLAIARQPAWSVGRWVVELDEDDAVRHARDAAAELPVAQAIIEDLALWQRALGPRDQ